MVKHISQNEFETEVLKEEGVVLVDFFANWCGPCKMLAPVLENIQDEMQNVKVVKVDIDENPGLAQAYGVVNIPTMKVFKAGEVLTTKVGFSPKTVILDMIEENL